MAANPFAKTVPQEQAYYKHTSPDGWTWYVRKLYKSPKATLHDSYARAFCTVVSPYAPSGDMGDVYVGDIPGMRAWLEKQA